MYLPQMCAARVIGLVGDMGAGKTTFVRGLVAALGGDAGRVSSPTFSLRHRYDTPSVQVHHLDLYRLAGDGRSGVVSDVLPDEVELLIAEIEQVPSDALFVIEWPDYFPPVLEKIGMVLRLYFIDLYVRRVAVYQKEESDV